MERKTQVHADDGKQELTITREFNLPVELLFRAYVEPEIVAQWMGTKVLKLDTQAPGSYRFETSDPQGNVVFSAHGTIHELSANQRIVRTFEMANALMGVQLELLSFEKLTDDTSKLTMQVVYQSVTHRDQQLKMPFAYGINMAHNRLEQIVNELK